MKMNRQPRNKKLRPSTNCAPDEILSPKLRRDGAEFDRAEIFSCRMIPKFFLFFLGFILWISLNTYSSPQIRTATNTIEIDIRSATTSIYISIPIHNTGDERLKIKSVKHSCKCVETIAHPEWIDPQQEKNVTLVLKSDIFVEAQKIFILSNDPVAPVLTLEIKLKENTQPEVVIHPMNFTVHAKVSNNMGSIDAWGGRITILDRWKDDLKIEVKPSHFLINVYTSEIRNQNGGRNTHYFMVFVSLAGGWPIGPVDANVTILTNHPNFSKVVIPLRGEMIGPVTVSPPYLDFAYENVAVGDRLTKTITFRAEGEPVLLGKILQYPQLENCQIQIEDNNTPQPKIHLSGTIQNPSLKLGSLAFADDNFKIEILKPKQYIQTYRLTGPLRPSKSLPENTPGGVQ